MQYDIVAIQRRALAITALAVCFLAIYSIALPWRDVGGVTALKGTWAATITEPGRPPREGAVSLPGSFKPQGLHPDTRVSARRRVTLPASPLPYTLWVENPQHALIVRWDNVEVARFGDPDSPDRRDRVDAPALTVFPHDPAGGEHLLTLEVQGDFGRGGLPGQILLGPTDQVMQTISRYEATKIGFAIGFSLIAMVNLGVAAGSVQRPLHLMFGLLIFATGLYAFEHADVTVHYATDPITRWRLRRVAEGLIVLFSAGFVSQFALGRTPTPVRVWMAVAGGSILASLIGPIAWLLPMEILQDSMVVLLIPSVGYALSSAARRGVPGAALLALSTVPPLLGAVNEIVVTHGLLPGESWLFSSIALFFVGAGLAVYLQDVSASERHRRLVAGSADALVTVDQDGVVLELNPAAERLLGAAAQGHPLEQLVIASEQRVVRAHLGRARLAADRSEFTVHLADDRNVVVESLATPLDDQVALVVLRDVTRRRRMDEGLLQAARVETAAVLTGGIAHDFNNMLGTLLGHVGLLRATLDDEAAQVRLGRMEDAIERASLLARRLLAIGGRGSSELSAVDLAAVAREAVDLVEPTLPAGVLLSAEIAPNLASALGAAQDLQHVLVNLLVNARDAVGTRGRIRLVCRPFAVARGPRGLLLVVEDDGPGVPTSLTEDIWMPFFTTKGPTRGTGLGLAVAAQILRDHHGHLWYEPRPGGGARFLVALREAAASDQSLSPPTRAGARIAVVDDEEPVRQVFGQALQRAGHEAILFASGDEARLWLHENRPDALVTDVVMPGIDGLTLAATARDLYPTLPIAVVSGFIPDGDLSSLASAPFERLDKPVRAQRVVEAIARLLNKADYQASFPEADIPTGVHFAPFNDLSAAAIGLDAEPVRA